MWGEVGGSRWGLEAGAQGGAGSEQAGTRCDARTEHGLLGERGSRAGQDGTRRVRRCCSEGAGGGSLSRARSRASGICPCGGE